MNKKVLTLCAGFLLAGSLLSTANAVDIKDIAGNGKYYKMVRSSQYETGMSGGWYSSTDLTAGTSVMYLIQEKNGNAYASTTIPDDVRAMYWTVTKRTLPGTTTDVYTFKNQLGKTLTYTDAAGNKQTEFYSDIVASDASGAWDGNTIRRNGVSGSEHIQMDYTADAAENTLDWGVDTAAPTYSLAFDFEEIEEETILAKDLNAELQNGFQIQIGETVDGEFEAFDNWATDDEGNGNLFAGTLYAEKANNAETLYYLRQGKDGDYIVLTEELWGGTNSDLNGTDNLKGYKFALYNEHDFGEKIVANNLEKNAQFQILKTYDFNDTDSLIVTMPKVQVEGMTKNYKVRVFAADVNNKQWLTIVRYGAAKDILTQDDAKEAPYIKLGLSNIVDFKDFAGKVWNITDVNGNPLSPDVTDAEMDSFESVFDPASEILLANPEGQWLPYYKNDKNYGFTNRESGITWNLGQDGNGDWVIREVGTNSYEVWNSKYATKADPDRKYVIRINEAQNADLGFTEKGYASYDEASTALNGHYITLKNGVTGATMYVGKDKDDNVILTEDAANAIEFRVKELKHDYEDHSGFAGVDTLRHYTTYYGYNEKGKLSKTEVDTVQFQHYRLFEHFSEKYLVYDKNAHKFILAKASPTENAHEEFNDVIEANGKEVINPLSAFVLKEKTNNTYNIVSNYDVAYPVCNADHTSHTEDFDNYFTTNLYPTSLKMEGNIGDADMDMQENIYNTTNEDRLALVDIETPEYMTVTGAQDTAKIYLQNFPEYYLYEQGVNGTNFLGMNNSTAEDKAAIFVDTAYVRNNTFKPQYLLAMGANHVDEIWDNHGSKEPVHLLHADTTYGRFLVNMVDSAKTYGIDRKSNPYIWEQKDDSKYYRLAFIDGYHTGDALYLNTENGKVKINLNNNDDKVCTFAFRFVDEDREGVKIETLYDKGVRGWLKYQNNVPVVTNDYEDAHVFLVDNTTTEAPTANETIAAEGAISVVATEGAVIIKGAEGKNVVIATILGKVVANETINSDNEMIAVPAGIAVVSVDGESFKVVVK